VSPSLGDVDRPRGIAGWIALARCILTVCWRHAGSRWYVFRDMPTWFVIWTAGARFEEEHSGSEYDDARSLQAQATAEMKLRLDRFRRDVETAAQEQTP
jgi:hypothetical protein